MPDQDGRDTDAERMSFPVARCPVCQRIAYQKWTWADASPDRGVRYWRPTRIVCPHESQHRRS